jgi:serine/threonine protein kinase
MSQSGEASGTESLRTAIQSQHPGITEEIEGAINTLRKLQGIAGVPQRGGVSAEEATDSSLEDVPIIHTAADTGGVREQPVLVAGEGFGRYQIVRLLGRGAMGAVYLAYDSQLHRHVALKTPSLEENRPTIERFFREARTAAQLRSPYICPVYDFGHIGSVYFLSMAYIDGEPLGRKLAQGNYKEGPAIATLIAKIARGMHKAHDAGIIHRDLKPDNIMIDQDGEPVIMDFGLARRFDEEVFLTSPGGILGTPAYMSPEQVEGDPKKIGPPTDIYSLGVILYQLLAGRLPFKGSLTSVLRQIGSAEPPKPSAVNADLGAASPLEPICLRMIAKLSAQRYPSMAEVVQALEQAFTKPPPPAPKPSVWGRLWSWACLRRTAPSAPAPAASASPKPAAPAPVSDAAAAFAPPAPDPLEQTSAEIRQVEQESGTQALSPAPASPAPAVAAPAAPAPPAPDPLEQTSAEIRQVEQESGTQAV